MYVVCSEVYIAIFRWSRIFSHVCIGSAVYIAIFRWSRILSNLTYVLCSEVYIAIFRWSRILCLSPMNGGNEFGNRKVACLCLSIILASTNNFLGHENKQTIFKRLLLRARHFWARHLFSNPWCCSYCQSSSPARILITSSSTTTKCTMSYYVQREQSRTLLVT
jgi:hypothetical protein